MKVFKEVKPLDAATSDSLTAEVVKSVSQYRRSRELIQIRCGAAGSLVLDVREARLLRTWLNKVIPS
jgi:hypothetical protein